MVARPAEDAAVLACLTRLEAAPADARTAADTLAGVPARAVEAALQELARRRGAEALGLIAALAREPGSKQTRTAARRVLYRLSLAGLAPTPVAPRPVVSRQRDRAARAWLSGVDGTGSRAVWILFEGSFGGLALCALILNDQAGILEAAGGAVSKKRLARELSSLRERQKLPWLEAPPERALALVGETLALHGRLGTEPPPGFARWRRFFGGGAPAPARDVSRPDLEDPTLLDHSAELLEQPELASWFIDPGALQSDALELLAARESRLVLSEPQKAERQAAILDRVLDRVFTSEARALWARRLREMAWIFDATGRARQGQLARAAASALDAPERSPRHLPLARALAERGLAFAAEVALGRVSAAAVSRRPRSSS